MKNLGSNFKQSGNSKIRPLDAAVNDTARKDYDSVMRNQGETEGEHIKNPWVLKLVKIGVGIG
jgi:hypothetical protein